MFKVKRDSHGLWFKVWGPTYLVEEAEGVGDQIDWMLKPGDWHGFGNIVEDLTCLIPLRPLLLHLA